MVVEGIIYRYRVGIPWRDLPECFGPWQTVWKRGLLGLPWVVWQVMLLVSAVLVGDSWLSQADG